MDKLKKRIESGTADANIPFDPLCALLRDRGFEMRVKSSSHRVFTRDGVYEIINLQPAKDGKAKFYQVKQVRDIFQKYDIK